MYALLDQRTEEIRSFTDWKEFQCHIRASIIRNDVPNETSFPHLLQVYNQLLPDQYNRIEETYRLYFSNPNCFLDSTISGGHPYVETLHRDPFLYDQSVKALTDVQQHFREIANMRVAYKASIYITDRFPEKVYLQLHQQSIPKNDETARIHHKLTRARIINDFLLTNV